MIPGFVRLSVTGEQRERFLNLCKSRGIMFRRIVQTGEKELLLTMRVKDFFLIGPLRRKTGVHIHILKKRGDIHYLTTEKTGLFDRMAGMFMGEDLAAEQIEL